MLSQRSDCDADLSGAHQSVVAVGSVSIQIERILAKIRSEGDIVGEIK
jgi:hypothetical protein